MTLSAWTHHLLMGREIEFRFKEDVFLLSYIPDTAPIQFFIWNSTKNYEMCRGDLNCILDFEFEPSVCLQNAANAFPVDYIL